MAEKQLRQAGALGPNESLLEWRQGVLEYLNVSGAVQPTPRVRVLGIPIASRLVGMSYSAARLYVGSSGKTSFDLARVMHAEARGSRLLVVVDRSIMRWRSQEPEDKADATPFAMRLLAQRDKRAALLEPADQDRFRQLLVSSDVERFVAAAQSAGWDAAPD